MHNYHFAIDAYTDIHVSIAVILCLPKQHWNKYTVSMVCSIEKSFIIRFDRIASLKLHMQQSHGVKLETRELRFKSMDEFMSRKKEEEKATKSYYVLHNGMVKTPTTQYHYYYCNRSGFYKEEGHGIRNIKCQNSPKIGSTCISHVTADECLETGAVTVTYVTTHTGHTFDVCHLPIPGDIKAQNYRANKRWCIRNKNHG